MDNGLPLRRDLGLDPKQSVSRSHRANSQRGGIQSASAADEQQSMRRLDGGNPPIAPCPLGRTCNLCPHKDDQWDPVELARGVQIFMWWAKPPNLKGQTVGNYCGYCCKYHSGFIKATMGLSITAYEGYLAQADRLQKHQRVIAELVLNCIARGGISGKVDYAILEEQVLVHVHKKDTVIKKPGYSHIEWNYYCLHNNGDPFQNGKHASQGHTEHMLEGVRGVLVPDAPISRIEFNDTQSAELQITKTERSDTDGIVAKHAALANSFFGFTQNNVGSCIDSLLASTLSKGEEQIELQAQLPAQPHAPSASSSMQINQFMPQQSLAMSPTPTPQRAHPSPTHMLAPPQSPVVQDGKAPIRRASAKAAPATPRRDGDGASGGLGHGAAGGGPGSAAKRKQGRPKKDMRKMVDEQLQVFVAARADDVVWWGAEAKSNLKGLRIIHKEIIDKIKTATNMAEVLELGCMDKQMHSMIETLDIVRNHGVNSPEFKEVFDLHISKLKLEPSPTEMTWPPHIMWARHKMDINETGDDERWFARISQVELAKCGIRNSTAETERFLAERIARALKLGEYSEAKHAMSVLFDPDRDVDLPVCVVEFYMAVAVALHYEGYTDLRERKELLDAALMVLDGVLPSPSRPGTTLGSALVSYPKGNKMVEDARLHNFRVSHTIKQQDALVHVCRQCSSTLETLNFGNDDVVAMSSSVEIVCGHIEVCHAILYGESASDCLPEFMPSATSKCILDPMAMFLDLMFDGWKLILGPMLSPLSTAASLSEGLRTSIDVRCVLERAHRVVSQRSQIFTGIAGDGLVSSESCAHAFRLSGWFVEVQAFVGMSAELETQLTPSLTQCQMLHETFTKDIISASKVVDKRCWMHEACASFLRSELVNPGGPFLSKLSQVLELHGRCEVEPLLAALDRWCGEGVLRRIRFADTSPEYLEKLANLEIPADVFKTAEAFAVATNDVGLIHQVRVAHGVFSLLGSIARAEVVAMSIYKGVAPVVMSARLIDAPRMALICDLRAQLDSYKHLAKTVELKLPVVDNVDLASRDFHLKILDGKFDMRDLSRDLMDVAGQLIHLFAESWTADIHKVKGAIYSMCPSGWELHKNSLCDKPDVCKLMLSNPHYNSIGPLCAELKTMISLVKKIHDDKRGPIVAVLTLKDAQKAIDHGIETVAFTYFVNATQNEWANISNLPTARKVVDELRSSLQSTGVVLTEQMEKLLEDWYSGDMLPHNRSESAKTSAPTVCPAPAVVVDVGANNGAEDSAGGVAVETAKRQPADNSRMGTLSQRMKKAKR
jgi:hypothetical protein